MADEMPYTGSFITIDNNLAEDIYTRVRSYAMLPKKVEKNVRRRKNVDQSKEYVDYFKDIFENGILQYFADEVMEMYGTTVNMDIISAIEKEAEYEHGIFDTAAVEQYVKQVFDETKVLAAPFIEKPLGEEKDPINSCTYNDHLSPHDESPRSLLIDKELKNFGGEEDSDIPLNMILFYKSFYGLRANDLSKFAPPEVSETYSRSTGEYFKAYYELIKKIHPEPHRSKVITPHIDRWWHNVSKMPDLDDRNQEMQEERIYAAFFWGLLSGYIDMFDVGHDEKVYRLDAENLGMESEDSVLVVSNSTPCDKLYEVLDSLAIYPELVNRILEDNENLIVDEIEKNRSIDNGILLSSLKSFRLREFPFPADDGVRSIFDLPLLLKKSVTREQFYEDRVVRILKTELDQIQKYLSRFYTEKELPTQLSKVLMEQYDKFLHDIEVEQNEWKDIYHDYLFSRTCGTIENKLKEMMLTDEAARVRERKLELSK